MPSSMKVLVHSSHLRGYWSNLDITLPKEHLVLLAEHPVAEKISYKMECGVCQYFVLHLLSDWDGDIIPQRIEQRPSLIKGFREDEEKKNKQRTKTKLIKNERHYRSFLIATTIPTRIAKTTK
jgi:hypothetical protein